MYKEFCVKIVETCVYPETMTLQLLLVWGKFGFKVDFNESYLKIKPSLIFVYPPLFRWRVTQIRLFFQLYMKQPLVSLNLEL